MMNRTYRRSILRTVRDTLSRFLAIFSIVALGVGFLAGLLASPGDMRLSADSYYDDTDMYDIQIASTLGLTEEDLAAVRAQEGVSAVMPAYDIDLPVLSEEGDSYTARLHSLPEDGAPVFLSRPLLQEGRLPEAPGECAVVLVKKFGGDHSWIGSTLSPDREDEEEDGPAGSLPDTLTVVGTLKSSSYLSMESEHTTAGSGTLDLILYLPPESFSHDFYTRFYLTVEGAKEESAFSEAYDDAVAAVTDLLEPLGEERARLRYEDILRDANEELDDAKAEYTEKKEEVETELSDAERDLSDAEREIEENRQKLTDAEKEIADGRKELADNRREYEDEIASARQKIWDGRGQLEAYQAQLEEGRGQLAEAEKQLQAGYAQLDEGDAQLAAAKAQLEQTEQQLAFLEQQGADVSEGRAALEAAKAEYEGKLTAALTARAELDGKQAELKRSAAELDARQAQLDSQRDQLAESEAAMQQTIRDAEAEFAEAEEKLADAEQEYRDGLQKLEDGKKELADGRKDYEDAKAEADEKLADAAAELEDAERKIGEIEEGEWYLFTREDNAGFASYKSNADKIAAIARVFPLFFFLVAALVALTTMTRMVEEERGQIGALKALGYSSPQIAAKYLFYASLASVTGSAVGLAFGLRIFPYIIINAYNIMYDIPRALTPFRLSYSLASSLAAILCTLGATLSACWAELREVPARLLLPKAPKAGKRVFLEHITPLWNRLKFTQKVTARNLIRYKKRFFMTVIGIAGCTALLVTGFGLKDSISNIVPLQFEELNQYELLVALGKESALEEAELQDILTDRETVEAFLPAMQNSGKMVSRQGYPTDNVILFVPEDVSGFSDYFCFRHRTDRNPVTFDEESVIITEKLSERQHLRPGDPITLENQDGRKATLTVTDVCENYVYHYLYLSPAAYEKAFGEPMEVNTVLCRLPQVLTVEEEHAFSTKLLDCPDVAATRFTTELSESFQNTIRSLNSIVLVLIFSAGVLAFVVLYNLTNINISEREKELATIKVLGFYNSEVSAYVYRETAILALIGTAAGLVLGVFLHQFVIRTAEIDIVMFGRSVYPLSFLWSALLTLAFSFLVNLVMQKRLRDISMVESMKAPE